MPIQRLDRTVFYIDGEGVEDWLSGLITNKWSNTEGRFAALLTPQGKIISDFFVYGPWKGKDEGITLDAPSKFADGLEKRLRMYRLRAPINIGRSPIVVYAGWGDDLYDNWGHQDPRHPSLGRRYMQLESYDTLKSSGDYNAHRLSLGVPDSQWDFDTAQVFPADANMDLLNGVNFSKGCFVGQEVVSRMKRMTTVKKRMRGIILDGEAKAGDRILSGERVIGDVLHVNGKMGMAMIRLDRLRAAEYELRLNGEPVAVMKAVDGLDH